MHIYLVNPSDVAFGVGVITPRWLYVLAAATPDQYEGLVIIDETLKPISPEQIQPGDVVGIGIHTANALRGYEIGRAIENNKRVLCLYRPQDGKRLSAMIAGSPDVTNAEYKNLDDAKKVIDDFFQ